MNLAASLIFFAAVTLGGVTYQYRIMLSDAVIYRPDGQVEEVRVINRGFAFCPADCRVHHRHRVHDVRWSCADADSCRHFAVFHVILRKGEDHQAALANELASN